MLVRVFIRPRSVIILLATFILVCCKKNSQTINPTTADADIYVAGYINGSVSTSQAAYWKNDTLVNLVDPGLNSRANGIAVNGKDVYVAGFVNPDVSDAVYWKNAVITALHNSNELPSTASALTISGGDVYVAGNITNSQAVYWKNATMVNLSIDGASTTGANAIFVQGSDIYVAGYSFSSANGARATYWKNGLPVYLDSKGNTGVAFGITMIGNDVYVAGTVSSSETSQAVYWKNGILNEIEGDAGAYGLTTNGSDLYVLDNGLSNLSYLKNGTLTRSTPNSPIINAHASAIAVKGNDVYIAGEVNDLAAYWKNGKLVNLSQNAALSGANAIVVIPK